MRIYLISFLIIFYIKVSGQENRKNWLDGPLTWDDFQEKEQSIVASELKYNLEFRIERQKIKDTVLYRFQTFCFMDRNLSWVNQNIVNEQYLTYNQIIFNIAELHRRQLQYELDRIRVANIAEQKLNQYITKINQEIEVFQEESKFGKIKTVVDQWYYRINDRLHLEEYSKIPSFRTKSIGFGYNFGFGGGILTGTLGEHFQPNLNVILGLDFTYKNSGLFMNMTAGNYSVKKDYPFSHVWLKGQKSFFTMLDLTYGYTIVDKPKIKLTPIVGISNSAVVREQKESEEKTLRIVDNNLIFGLNVEYKIRKIVSLATLDNAEMRSIRENSIRTRVYISRVNYFNDLNGFSFNFSVGFSIFNKGIILD
jgi:hypothetical protein